MHRQWFLPLGLSLRIGVLTFATACLPSLEFREELSPVDSGQEDEQIRWRIEDGFGNPWPADATPRRPRILLGRTLVPMEPEDLHVFRIASEDGLDTLLSDLEGRPLRASTLETQIPIEITSRGEEVEVFLRGELSPGEEWALAIPSWAVRPDGSSELFFRRLRVAERNAGAELLESWPAHGAQSVPSNLPALAFRFDQPLGGNLHDIALEHESGREIPTTRVDLDCETLSWESGSCFELVPREQLPEGEFRVEFGTEVQDGTGAPLRVSPILFRVTSSAGPPAIQPTPCALPLIELHPGICALTADREIELLLSFDRAARVRWDTRFGLALDVASRGEAELRLQNLLPDHPVEGTLSFESLDGGSDSIFLRVRTEAALPSLAITEARTNPSGAEPHQEYVELWNYGEEAISLAGMRITDAPESPGDSLPASTIQANERVLLVAERFDPEDSRDDPVPAGSSLVRVGPAIATGGITNSGETLYLFDAEGRLLSTLGALSSDAESCVHRQAPEGDRTGTSVELAPCSPGS